MENRKYIVHLIVGEVFSYEVEANSEDEASNKVYQGEVEPYDSEMLEKYVTDCVLIEPEEKYVTDCVLIEPEEKYEPDTPLEGCALF